MFTYSAKCWKVSSNVFGIKENSKSEENLCGLSWLHFSLLIGVACDLCCRCDTSDPFSLSLYIWWTVLWFYIVYLIAMLITILVYLIQSRWLTSQVHDFVCAPEVLVCLDLSFRFILVQGPVRMSCDLSCSFFVWPFFSSNVSTTVMMQGSDILKQSEYAFS